ncbi:hypothetical protein ABPG74_010097 [Tetrahymena malaccensis]
MQYQQLNQNNDCQWCRYVVITLFYGIFGGFFYAFSTDPERYSKCKDNQFLNWNTLAMILCLSIAGISAFKLLIHICELFQKCPNFWAWIEAFSGIFVLICTIGLTVNDNKDCGQLHTVAMVFYILVYISLGILGLICCCSCLLFARYFVSTTSLQNDRMERPFIVSNYNQNNSQQ